MAPGPGKRFLKFSGLRSPRKSFASVSGTVHDGGEMSQSPLIIAIDGPAASGKSTVAKRVAAALGIVFVNSGAMYRAFTWWVLQNGIDPGDTSAVRDLLARTEFACGEEDGIGTIAVAGVPMTRHELAASDVNAAVSPIAAIPEVRERLVSEQRRYASARGVAMEGRDIGSVVFPETPHKFYIDASPEVREARRRAEGIEDSIAKRDRIDSSRKASPLVVSGDALIVDSSDLSADEVVDAVIAAIREKMGD